MNAWHGARRNSGGFDDRGSPQVSYEEISMKAAAWAAVDTPSQYVSQTTFEKVQRWLELYLLD